jgi:hypothetical protein
MPVGGAALLAGLGLEHPHVVDLAEGAVPAAADAAATARIF